MMDHPSQDHLNHITLWYLVQHSLSSYQKLIRHFGSAHSAIQSTNLEKWSDLSLHKNHVERATHFQTSIVKMIILNNCSLMLIDHRSYLVKGLIKT